MPDIEELDHYQLLGVSRSASPEEIKRAYHREMLKYHPDRYVNATPEQQGYAQRRSQRLTEAYNVLNDSIARRTYNRRQPITRPSNPTVQSPSSVQPRDYQAELYEQAREHLAAGRTLQAIGVLRQLQQINPFYRDSTKLLAAAEANARVQQVPKKGRVRGFLLLIGTVLSVAIIAVALWAFLRRAPVQTAGSNSQLTTQVAVAVTAPATIEPTSALVPTARPTILSAPTAQPAESSTRLQPTAIPPTAVPPTTVPPTAEPSAIPTIVATTQETGALLFKDTFNTGGWAELRSNGWTVGYQGQRYHITINPGIGTIWSYRNGPASDVSIGVDVQVTSGEGGLLLRFVDAQNYLSFSIDPQQTSYRLEQRSRGLTNVLAGGQSEAIKSGRDQQNRLIAQLTDDRIVLLANGQKLAEVDASTVANSSRYGLLGVSSIDTSANVYFDNLEIHELE